MSSLSARFRLGTIVAPLILTVVHAALYLGGQVESWYWEIAFLVMAGIIVVLAARVGSRVLSLSNLLVLVGMSYLVLLVGKHVQPHQPEDVAFRFLSVGGPEITVGLILRLIGLRHNE